MPISPTQAAHIAKVSRRTIMRALEAKEIKAFRDNRNHWQIDPDSLAMWAGAQSAPNGQVPTPAQPIAHQNPVEIARLQERLDASEKAQAAADVVWRERLASTEADRDAWRAQAQELARGRSWWHWFKS